ncbi:hypothetical protein J7L48_05490, partial [bacterium]|nr:hypothetical protein [bacterium]
MRKIVDIVVLIFGFILLSEASFATDADKLYNKTKVRSNTFITVYNDLNTMVKTIEVNSSDKLPLFIEKGHLKLTNLDRLNLGKTPPTITFRKINPTRY